MRFLVILFIINGEPTLLDGWWPMRYETQEICEEKKKKVLDYISDINVIIECREDISDIFHVK